MAAMTEREKEELAARHAIMRDTVAAQAEQLTQAQARIRELEGELEQVRDSIPLDPPTQVIAHLEDEVERLKRAQCTPEERAVLDACDQVPSNRLLEMADGEHGMALSDVGMAMVRLRAKRGERTERLPSPELARRAAGKGGS